MKNQSRQSLGIGIALLGFIVIVLVACDYLLNWNTLNNSLIIIGLMLGVIGIGLARRKGKTQGERKEQV
jgi:dipeptide/tripeptide permease